MAKLYFYYSAMNAGKSTTLLQAAYNYRERGLRPLLLTPRLDVLITTGGASVGDRDRVKRVLQELGARFFVDGVALKPGKPVAVARLGDTALVVLPGNPGE